MVSIYLLLLQLIDKNEQILVAALITVKAIFSTNSYDNFQRYVYAVSVC